MPAKIISYGSKAMDRLLIGVNTLADAVIVTQGPKGCDMVLDKSFGSPMVTKDGVTVAIEIELANRLRTGATGIAGCCYGQISMKSAV